MLTALGLNSGWYGIQVVSSYRFLNRRRWRRLGKGRVPVHVYFEFSYSELESNVRSEEVNQ